MTQEQVQAANFLVNDAISYAPLIAFIREIPPELATKLREAHNAVGWGCGAQSEDQTCCLAVLLADPADYAPEKIAAAEELLARHQASLHQPR